MSSIAICCKGLSKQYRIGGKQEAYRTFRDAITDTVTAPFRRASQLLKGQAYGAAGLQESIWALKDVSIDIPSGDVMGIIGRNGAGKSTLLKILARTTDPTEGYVDLFGRVGALLEVGTGFHPELTGRENVYLNGAILGMTRVEINRKFDEIVDFAEIEKFIDTPVKYYSSGMGLRLGFAVAAHLEPEILIVDEVLAVGDAAFQKKCMGKMSEVGGEGRTVLLVSHNMASITSLCEKVLWLDGGQIVELGAAGTVVDHYLRNVQTQTGSNTMKTAQKALESGKPFQILGYVLRDDVEPNAEGIARSGQPLTIGVKYQYDPSMEFKGVIVNINFLTEDGFPLFSCLSRASHGEFMQLPPTGELRCHLPRLPLLEGNYLLDIWIKSNEKKVDQLNPAGTLQVWSGDFFGTGKLPARQSGVVLVEHHWEFAN